MKVLVTVHAEGITNPPIDDLLSKVDSKYRLVLFAAKRARQINAYYSQLAEGLLENVGPLVDTSPQEKPLSIALREVNAKPLDRVHPVVVARTIGPGCGAIGKHEIVGRRLLRAAGKDGGIPIIETI